MKTGTVTRRWEVVGLNFDSCVQSVGADYVDGWHARDVVFGLALAAVLRSK